MLGVLARYFMKQVLHFDYLDFQKALFHDLGCVLGELGLWTLTNYCNRRLARGHHDKYERGQICMDLIREYLQPREAGNPMSGQLGRDAFTEEKYLQLNKLARQTEQRVKRATVKHVYSWNHYAPSKWSDYQLKQEMQAQTMAGMFKRCNNCGSAEAKGKMVFGVCGGCKQAFYCSGECQKEDWGKKHKNECKEWAKDMEEPGKKPAQ